MGRLYKESIHQALSVGRVQASQQGIYDLRQRATASAKDGPDGGYKVPKPLCVGHAHPTELAAPQAEEALLKPWRRHRFLIATPASPRAGGR